MDVLTELVRNVMLIILLTTFLDMIMPSSSMQRFVKVVMGLFVLIAIFNPILNLINKEQDLEAFIWQQEEPSQLQVNSIIENGARLQKVNQDLVQGNYRKKIEEQIESIIKTVHGVDTVEVSVKLEEKETVNKSTAQLFEVVTISVGMSNQEEEKERGTELIKPVKIKLEHDYFLSNEKQLMQKDIVKTLSQYFGLKDEQIIIRFI